MVPKVAGRCPACDANSLFLGAGGHVTCAVLSCSDPAAADRLLSEQSLESWLREQARREGVDLEGGAR